MPNVRFVLVEPREAGNVGAVARAMKNFGFDDLVIVGEHPDLLPVAGWWASGADDLLARATFVPALADALGDAQMTVATTSMRGRTSPVTFTPKTLAVKAEELGAQRVALVFGREDRGLTGEELALCQYTAAIPANERFPTMNLAQSACVFAYELAGIEPRADARTLPDAALVERMHEKARALLLEIGFLHENNPDRIYDDVRAMIARAELDARETTIVLGIIRQFAWKLRMNSSDARD